MRRGGGGKVECDFLVGLFQEPRRNAGPEGILREDDTDIGATEAIAAVSRLRAFRRAKRGEKEEDSGDMGDAETHCFYFRRWRAGRVPRHGLNMPLLWRNAEDATFIGIFEEPERPVGSDFYVADAVADFPSLGRLGIALLIEGDAEEGFTGKTADES